MLTLSIVPVRRIPTCCILLVAPRVRLQSSKKGFTKWKRKCIDPFVPIAVVGPSHFGISSAIKVYIVFCEEESIISSLKGLVAILPPGGDKLDFIPTLVYQTSCHPSRGSRGLHPPPRFFWPPVFLQPSLLTQGRNKQLGFNSPLMYMLHEASLY